MGERVFDGLKVIDCASFIAGPAAATVMLDSATGDQDRTAGYGRSLSPKGAAADRTGTRRQSRICARRPNKRSLALDLRSPAGQAVLGRLVADTDVFITNYPPPVRRRLGIIYEDLAPLNPRLIYASFTGYGETGPEADKPGFDATAWWARSGLMHLVRAGEEAGRHVLTGDGDDPPQWAPMARSSPPSISVSAPATAPMSARHCWPRVVGQWLLGAGGTVRRKGRAAAATRARGMRCDPLPLPRQSLDFVVDRRRRVALGKVQGMHGDGVLDDPRYATAASREAHARELIPILDEFFATEDQAEWRRILDEAGLISGVVADLDEIHEDEQILASQALVPFTDELTDRQQPAVDRRPGKAGAPSRPAVGQHSAEILREAGYADAEIRALREAGVIGRSSASGLCKRLRPAPSRSPAPATVMWKMWPPLYRCRHRCRRLCPR